MASLAEKRVSDAEAEDHPVEPQARPEELRLLEGMTIPANDGGWPLQLITKANVGTPNNSLQAPTGYQAQFEKLWGVG